MSVDLPIVSPARVAEICQTVGDQVAAEPAARGDLFPGGNALALPDNNKQRLMQKEFVDSIGVLRKEQAVPGVLVSPDHQMASLLQTFLAEKSAEDGKIEIVANTAQTARVAMFDEQDWRGWAQSFFTWWKKIVPHQWLETPSNKRLGNSARIGILGDWGTGLYGAPVCAKSIEADEKGYDVLLHLGDVYYSGDKKEVQERFLAVWPDPAKAKWPATTNVINRACNSNHEMYTGGHAYFNFTLSKFEQSASYFALHNDHWILAGLDTGYLEGDLMGRQAEWLTELISTADGKRVILLSHHQPFSWFEKGYHKITNKLNDLLINKKIFAWYWGHEHRSALYDIHPEYGLHGRCVGHSGYPYFRDNFGALAREEIPKAKAQNLEWRLMPFKATSPAAMILDGPNPYVEGYVDKFGPNGYMTLEFNDKHLNEIVHAADGTVLYERPLT